MALSLSWHSDRLSRRCFLKAGGLLAGGTVFLHRLDRVLQADGGETTAPDFEKLARIEFLPGLEKLDLRQKADIIQSLIEQNFFHPSGLFYSLLLIDGPHSVRPLRRDDLKSISDAVAEGHYDDQGETSEAARNEGMTFENSITSAGNYLQSQAARFAVTENPTHYAEAQRAFHALVLIYEDGKRRGRSGWLGKP